MKRSLYTQMGAIGVATTGLGILRTTAEHGGSYGATKRPGMTEMRDGSMVDDVTPTGADMMQINSGETQGVGDHTIDVTAI